MTRTDTGPNPAVREAVRRRAEDCCELCGLWAVGVQIHHRRPRAMGGSSDRTANLPSNLVLFCALCHRDVETIQRSSAYKYGWLVPQGGDPKRVPFLLSGDWVFLTDAGTYQAAPDPDPGQTERELF